MAIIPKSYEMLAWQLNDTYDLIENCRVVKPPYEVNWMYGKDFFLDKRLGLTHVLSESKKFLDMKTIKWREFFLYRQWTKHYIGTMNGSSLVNITPSWFEVDNDSPTRLALGRNVYWPKKTTTGTIANPQLWMWGFNGTIPWYSGWYVKFQYSGATMLAAWDKVLFTSGVLKGGVNEVYWIDWGYAYIIGTNVRWSTPEVGTTFEVYTNLGQALIVGHKTWVSMVILDWMNEGTVINVLNTTSPIIDVVNFDGNIFATTANNLYFSRTTGEDNTQFYPLDNFWVENVKSLFPVGKAMLVFWDQNKLFSGATGTSSTIWYVWYDLNYNGKLFSKYSFHFSDSTIQILQNDNQLVEVNVTQVNSTSFELQTKNVMQLTRWLFEDLSGGEVRITSSDRFINFLYINGSDTKNYQYDKQFQHWIVNTYKHRAIYYFGSKVIGDWFIAIEDWYTDNWVAYAQSVNFSYKGFPNMSFLNIVRTLFWYVDNNFDINMKLDVEIDWRLISKDYPLKGYNFDQRLNVVPSGDEIIWYDDWTWFIEYDWNVVSIQNSIRKTWRYFRIWYYSLNRFIIWESFAIVTETNKPYINELSTSNYN